MKMSLRGLGLGLVAAMALAAAAAAQTGPDQPSGNPICARLEAQLANLERGAADSGRGEQIRRYEESIARQQADLDRAIAQSRRQGCDGIGGFFSLFTGQSQCGPINSQIQQMRANLDRALNDLERLKSGGTTKEGPRRALIGQLAQYNCGPQYRAAAAEAGPSGFLDALFGGTIINPGGDGAPSGTYRTVCVRTCDGYYFPISYSTAPSRFAEDQRSCQRLCPAAEAVLYSYRNPGEDINQAVSVSGHAYTELPTAFLYRREFNAACSCRKPGQSWAEALRNADDSSTLERGDIVVTDQNAKALSQPPPKGPPAKPGTRGVRQPGAGTASSDATGAGPDQPRSDVRAVGPPFVAGH